ncbi:hypothetical protein BX666DRAFT_1657245 [Dichotomocladium elegans]|nr:hypothetical protein BX666DRAFT_1657245 [Dichotomocladium elegans]
MSGSDVRDILQLGKASESSGPKRPKQPNERRPDGISRELYSLIGSAPSVALVKPAFKAKFTAKKKATPWAFAPFKNQARTDDLELHHWIRAAYANESEYPHAFKEVAPSGVISYTDEEYSQYLQALDNSWTREDTDHLFDLCRRYDLRFVVIADRFNGTPSRSVEDLKDRYYSICRTLMKERLPKSEATFQQYAFDKEREVERKQALETLYTRTKEQMDEEEALLVEVKRIEQNEARLNRERESVMQMLAQLPVSRGSTGASVGNNFVLETKKRRRNASNADMVGRSDDSVLPKEKLAAGVHVQSQRLAGVKPSMHEKVLTVMNEVAVGQRPVMPTANVCQAFEHLQSSLAVMFELKKVVDKLEIEHKVKTLHKSPTTSRRRRL